MNSDVPFRLSAFALVGTGVGLFVDPPVGRVGMTEAEARATGRNVLVATRPMKHVGRAIEMSETDGFMKFLVDADTEEILGAVIFGVGCDEVIHSLLDVMYARASYRTILRAVHIHAHRGGAGADDVAGASTARGGLIAARGRTGPIETLR